MTVSRILLAALSAGLLIVPAGAQRSRDQNVAFKDAQRGRIMPLPKIEKRAREHPAAKDATYLGPELIGETTYRLKFMRAGRVLWIDLDARNGRVLGTSTD